MDKGVAFQTPDDLLIALVQNKERLGIFVNEIYGDREDRDQGIYYNGLFGMLQNDNYLVVRFADDIAYYVSITAKGYIYASQIARKKWKVASMNFALLRGKYREDLLKILDLYPDRSLIPEDSGYNESIGVLRTKGYLSQFTRYIRGWGVSYTYDDLNYLLLEEDYLANQERSSMKVNITGGNNQVNYATDYATVQAAQNNGIDANALVALINSLKEHSEGLSSEDKQSLNDSIEVIQTELTSSTPRKSFVNIAMNTLKAINGTVQFAAAVAALFQFIQLFKF